MLKALLATILAVIIAVLVCSPTGAAEILKRPTYTEDVIAIHQLLARYANAIDSGDGKEWAATFTEDGVFEYVGRSTSIGREKIAALVRPGRKPYASRHMVQSPWIKVDGDTAILKAYLIVTRGTEIIVTGGYDDKLKRVNGEWLFAERHFTDDKPPEPTK